jgi:cell wall-associated NlpC family hydrolase
MATTLAVGVARAAPWTPAAPPSITTLKQRVDTLENELANEARRSDALSQQFDAIQSRLASLDARLAATVHKVTVTSHRLTRTHRQLQRDAVLAYVLGTSANHSLALFSQNANQSEASSVYQQTAIANLSAIESRYQNESLTLAADKKNLKSQRHFIAVALNRSDALVRRNHSIAVHTGALVRSMGRQLRHLVLEAAIAQARAEAAANAAAAAGAAGVAGQLGGQSGLSNALQGFSGTINGSGTGNSAGMRAFAAAESQIGVPYVWGGETPGQGFDCSGLTQWSWAQAGVYIPRTASEQWDYLPHVSLTDLQPGDLLFYFNLDGDDQVDHVVMYGGSGPYGTQTTIAAAYTGTTISLEPAFTYGLIGAGRP